jgi:hypothetical protein
VALAGQGASQRKSGFAEMVDTDRIQKRADLTCGFFYCVAAVRSAAPPTSPHMLMFLSIATPQEVLINDLAPPGSFLFENGSMPTGCGLGPKSLHSNSRYDRFWNTCGAVRRPQLHLKRPMT